MPWQTLPNRRKRRYQDPAIRIHDVMRGHLNAAAMEQLSNGERCTAIEYAVDDLGRLSITGSSREARGSFAVSRNGMTHVGRITERAPGARLPVTLALLPAPEEPHRLIVGGPLR